MSAPTAGPQGTPAGKQVQTEAPTGALREWHGLRPDERDLEWDDLVCWAVWLHDWYGLSGTGGLPDCWPEHPGLIEELRALKAWRERLYDGETEAGQGAGYWHDHLRRVLAAANSMYAPSCNAGHRTSARPADTATRETWAAADPASHMPDAGGGHALPAALSGRDMDALIAAGRARLAGPARHLKQAALYRDHWWQHQAGQWRLVTSPATAAELSRLADLNQQAQAAAEQVTRSLHPEPPQPDDSPQPDNGA
jgi:hypothetical protein